MVVNTKSVKLPIPFTTFTHVLGSGLHSTNGDIARSILYISVKTDGLNMGAANFVILASAPNVFEVNERTSFIAPNVVYAGENEMASLSGGALRVLRGEEEAKVFKKNF